MSRRFVGTWADQLFSVTQTQAIAALGVLAGSAPRNSRLDTAEQIATALHAAAPGSEGPVGVRYLRWGAYDKTTWDELKQRMKPALAAAGWERFTRSFGRVDLRVISQYMTDAEAAETYWWLADRLWSVAVRVRSVSFEWWLNTAGGHRDFFRRTAWHWPLRLGFLPDEASQALLAEFYSSSHDWIRTLAQPLDLESTSQSCDLLVSPLGLSETAGCLRRFKVSATAILLAGDRPMDTIADAVESQKFALQMQFQLTGFIH
jgi:hypothetical protein